MYLEVGKSILLQIVPNMVCRTIWWRVLCRAA